MTLFEKSTSMQIIPFPAHYQSIYTNFDISSFSLISCRLIRALSRCKSCLIADKDDSRKSMAKYPCVQQPTNQGFVEYCQIWRI